jgi:UV DNA damage endonuclease
MSSSRPVQLGLCCINTILRAQKPPVFASRKMIIRSIQEQGIDVLKEKILQNLRDVLTMIDWNEANGIRVMRLSSEMFPHKSNPKVVDYTYDFARDLLKQIGVKAKQYGHRLTFHPGQYNVVGSPVRASFEQTIVDLSYHADVLDLIDAGDDSVMVVHGGGVYGDKQATIERWCEQYQELPENVQRRLVLENCEKCFSIEDCLRVAEKINIPVVFDTHHYACYCKLHPEEKFKPASEYIPAILETWTRKNIKPKFHVSEQGSGRVGHHSDFIEVLPEYLLNIPQKYGIEIDIMIEAKMKEQAILKLYEKYPDVNCKKGTIEVQPKQVPGTGWVKKNCLIGCECCDGPKKKKKKKKRLVIVEFLS